MGTHVSSASTSVVSHKSLQKFCKIRKNSGRSHLLVECRPMSTKSQSLGVGQDISKSKRRRLTVDERKFGVHVRTTKRRSISEAGDQWTHLRVGAESQYDQLICLLNQCTLSRLHDLTLDGCDPRRHSGARTTLRIPSLQRLRLGRHVTSTARTFAPWDQLTRCELNGSNIACIADLANVQELVISEGVPINEELHQNSSPNILPKLAVLCITEMHLIYGQISPMLHLFNNFRLPALHTLLLEASASSGSLAALSLGLLPESILTLSIATVRDEDAARCVADAIRPLTHLRSLHLGGSHAPTVLAMLSTDLPFLSRLRHVHITPHESPSLWCIARSLATFTLARMSAGYAPLSTLRVYMSGLVPSFLRDTQTALETRCVGGQEVEVVGADFVSFED